MKASPQFTNNAYFIGLCLIALGLPFSKFLVSASQFVLLGAWILSGDWAQKWKAIRTNKLLWSVIAIYLLHLIGAVYSSDFQYAIRDLRIKLPMLSLPIIAASMPKLTSKKVHFILALFCLSVFGGTIIGMAIGQGLLGEIENTRKISVFISHIRFSIEVVLALVFLPFLLYKESATKVQWMFGGFAWLFMLAFLFVLKAFTGIVILAVITPVFLFIWSKWIAASWLRLMIRIAMVFVPLTGVLWIGFQVAAFYNTPKNEWSNLDPVSASGEVYEHRMHEQLLENGHRVWIYLAWREMAQEWEAKSEVSFNGQTKNQQSVSATLIRFLTSKGLRKDADGVRQLSTAEIKAIEAGIANVRFMQGSSMSNSIYQFIWEINNFTSGGNPQNNTIGQRFEFWKTGWSIWKKHWIVGVGTGDVQLAFDAEYDLLNTQLEPQFRLHSHNQFLTIGVALGVLGLLVFIWSLVAPFVQGGFASNTLYVVYWMILMLSMLNEDTLETQMGLSLYAFFNTLFVFIATPDERPHSI